MAAEGDAVQVLVPALEERLHHAVSRDHGTGRRIGRGEPLGGRDQVGPDVVALGSEPGAQAPEAADDLVGAEQDPVAVAQLAHALEVPLRRRERATRVLYRLHEHHRDRARIRLLDRTLELLEQQRGELLLGLLRGPPVAIRVADVDHVGHEWLERRPELRDAVERQRPERRAVVGDPARDRLPAPITADGVVLARQLPGRLDGLRAARDEEHPVEVAGGQAGHLGGELDRARVRGAPVRVVGELAHLRGRDLADLLPVAVADVDAEEPAEPVQVALAVRVLEVTAVAADDHRKLALGVGPHARHMEPQVILRGLLQFGGRHPYLRRAHDPPINAVAVPGTVTTLPSRASRSCSPRASTSRGPCRSRTA